MIFRAELVAIGMPGTFINLRGTVDSVFDNTSSIFSNTSTVFDNVSTVTGNMAISFDMLLNDGQGFTKDTILEVLLASGTRFYSTKGEQLDRSHIKEGVALSVAGVIRLSSVDPDLINAIMIMLDTEAGIEKMKVEGIISNLDPDHRTFDVKKPDDGMVCVAVPDDAHIILIIKNEEDTEYSTEVIEIKDLMNGQDVDVFGIRNSDNCITARVILAEGS